MKLLPCLAVVWTLLALGCKDESPTPTGGATTSGIDRSQLCREGGATLNAATNECVCAQTQTWNGIRCERGAGGSLSLAAAAEPPPNQPPTGAAAPATPVTGTGAEASDPPPALTAEPPRPRAVDAPLRAVCHRAKGRWLADEGFCLCPGDNVLVGTHCRQLPGRVTDDACLHAVHKGHWRSGSCSCDEGLVFAPARGGCVQPVLEDQVVLRRECESSMNQGHWNAARGLCTCPSGRLWKDEACLAQFGLTSREVCESAVNSGKWDEDHKRCLCVGKSIWLDQHCSSTAGVTQQVACESEQGGGAWNSALSKCICPRLGVWNTEAWRCDE